MRVAIVSFDQPYQNHVTNAIQEALAHLGHDSHTFLTKDPFHGRVDVSGWPATHIFSVNIPRSRIRTSATAHHFTLWVQDLDHTPAVEFYRNDLTLYSINNWRWIPNGRFLPPGTDYGRFLGRVSTMKPADVMLSGFVHPSDDRTPVRIGTAVNLVSICRRRGWSLRITGLGWEAYPFAAPFHVGYVEPGRLLAEAYQTAKVTLHDNLWTNLQPRVLEAFACGGFCLPRAMPGDATDFDPHLPIVPRHHDDDLEDVLADLIENDAKRKEITEAAGEIIRSGHTWKDRMLSWIRQIGNA